MWHLLALPFILIGVLISGVFTAIGVALFSALLIPLILLAVFFRVGFFLRAGLVIVLLALLVSWI